MGDFNAKIGGIGTGGKLIGKFCLGDRKNSGERFRDVDATGQLPLLFAHPSYRRFAINGLWMLKFVKFYRFRRVKLV